MNITATAAEEKAMFATENIIQEMQKDIPKEEFMRFAELEEGKVRFDKALAVYTTTNVTSDSTSMEETLEFQNEYIIPSEDSEGNGAGMYWLIYNEEWRIQSYWYGLDLLQMIEEKKGDTFYCVDPLHEWPIGFLTVTEDGERYQRLSASNERLELEEVQTEEFLMAVKQAHMQNTNLDGTGSGRNGADLEPYSVMIAMVLIAAGIITVILMKKDRKAGL